MACIRKCERAIGRLRPRTMQHCSTRFFDIIGFSEACAQGHASRAVTEQPENERETLGRASEISIGSVETSGRWKMLTPNVQLTRSIRWNLKLLKLPSFQGRSRGHGGDEEENESHSA